MLITYTVQGSQTTDAAVYQVKPTSNLTLADVESSFPEPGKYHFRAKQSDQRNEYVWLDLVSPKQRLPQYNGKYVLKALPIYYRDDEGDGDRNGIRNGQLPTETELETKVTVEAVEDPKAAHQVYLQQDIRAQQIGVPHEVGETSNTGTALYDSNSKEEDSDLEESSDEDSEEDESEDEHLNEHPKFAAPRDEHTSRSTNAWSGKHLEETIQHGSKDIVKKISKSAFGGFLKASAKAAMSLASEVSRTASNTSLSGRYPSGTSLKVLRSLLEDLTHPVDAQKHQQYYQRLWKATFPAESFEDNGELWALLGAPGGEPRNSFRACGVLGLKSIVYFAESNQTEFRSLARDYSETDDGTQTLSILAVGIRLCRSLSQLLKLDGGMFEDTPREYWAFFSSRDSYFSLYVTLWRLFERERISGEGLDKAGSNAIQSINLILDEKPMNVREFEHVAEALGITF